jgi:hypothetical protein
MSAPKKAPNRGAIRGQRSSSDLPGQLDHVSTRSSRSAQTADDDIAVNDGLRQLGLIKPHDRAFEAYAVIGANLEYLGKAESRAEALRLIQDARP